MNEKKVRDLWFASETSYVERFYANNFREMQMKKTFFLPLTIVHMIFGMWN